MKNAMTKSPVSATITHAGLEYTGTIDRSSRSERPVTVACSDGTTNTGEWDGGIGGISSGGDGEWPTMAITLLDEALERAYRAVL